MTRCLRTVFVYTIRNNHNISTCLQCCSSLVKSSGTTDLDDTLHVEPANRASGQHDDPADDIERSCEQDTRLATPPVHYAAEWNWRY